MARKRATRESDIDLFVVSAEPLAREIVLEVAYEVMEGLRFETFINVTCLSQHKFQKLARMGSPLISNVLEEGAVLYDDGTFASVCLGIHASG